MDSVTTGGQILVKTPEQIDGIRKSCKLVTAALDYVNPFVVAGTTTEEINQKIAKFLEDHGATSPTKGYGFTGHPFPAETCISLNEEICHGIPSSRKVKNGDIVKVDVVAKLNGYYGDTCRTFIIGDVSRKTKELVECTKHCLQLGIEQVKPGNHFGDIGFVIARYAHACGYSVVEGFGGHGLGIFIHENPHIEHNAPKGSGQEIKEGYVFTIEPMLAAGNKYLEISKIDHWTASTIDKSPSAQFEHAVLCTKDGFEILT